MREIAIIGVGQTPVRENWEYSIRDLAASAVLSALEDAGRDTVEGLFVGNMLSGPLNRQEQVGTLIADWVGLKGSEAYKIEAACGSGASAVRMAIMAVGSGEKDCALAVGVEKMTETLSMKTGEALATAADADYESIHGLSFVAINALVMLRYMHTYGWNHQDFAPFSINAHANAFHNPFARLRQEISQEEYNHARMVASPINLLDASPIGDGAAAILIVSADQLSQASC